MLHLVAVVICIMLLSVAIAEAQELTAVRLRAMGSAINEELRRQSPPIEDALLAGYLTALAERINERARLPFPISIDLTRDAAQTGALGLPGGFLRLPLAALIKAPTERDVALALAHGMAHSAAHHVVRTDLASVPIIFPSHDRFDFPRQRKQEEEANGTATTWLEAFEPGNGFEAAQQRAREIAEAIAFKPKRKPTLRRPGESR